MIGDGRILCCEVCQRHILCSYTKYMFCCLAPGTGVNYDGLQVCLSLRWHSSKRHTPTSRNVLYMLPVGCGRGSVLLWRQCNTLCILPLLWNEDDVMFSHNGANTEITHIGRWRIIHPDSPHARWRSAGIGVTRYGGIGNLGHVSP